MKYVLAAIFSLYAFQAGAQQACAPREVFAAYLSERFGEVLQSYGLAESGQVVEIFASPKTRSWTVLVTSPDQMSCAVASGVEWERLPTGEMG